MRSQVLRRRNGEGTWSEVLRLEMAESTKNTRGLAWY